MQQGDRLDGVQQAALLRERGQIVEAVTLLDQVMTTCEKNGDWIHFADALAERIVCWKHHYQNSRGGDREKFLRLMHRDAKWGLRLQVPVVNKALFYQCLGDYFTIRGDVVLAQRSYEKAYELVKDTLQACEYKVRWAESLPGVG